MDVQLSLADLLKDKTAWFCVFAGVSFFMYLLKRFLRGREQVKRNCDLIGKQLEHLKRIVEENERKEKEQRDKEAEDNGKKTSEDCSIDKKDK